MCKTEAAEASSPAAPATLHDFVNSRRTASARPTVRPFPLAPRQVVVYSLTTSVANGLSLQATAFGYPKIEEPSPLYHQGLDIDTIRIIVHGTVQAGSALLRG